MAASLARLAKTMPVPIFGTLGTATAFGMSKAKILPRFAGWAGPLAIGGLWFVWPAVDDNWKIEMGFKADPEAAAKAAAAAAEEAAKAKKVELPPEAIAKVEDAYKSEAHVETEDDKMLAKAASSGEYSELETKWDEFIVKSTKPGEDDDDDDDDDDDEDEEEEEEEDDDE